MVVALRDADTERAKWFAAQLKSLGQPRYETLVAERAANGPVVMIPGGLAALAFIAGAKERARPERFLAEYARTVADRSAHVANGGGKFAEQIEQHFKRLAELEAFGKRSGTKLELTLSLRDKGSRRTTEKILPILGMKLHNEKGRTTVEMIEKGAKSQGQETASALAIDMVAMQEALAGGKSYTLEVPFEPATVFPDEATWREFYSKDNLYGGLTEAMARDPKIARAYAALAEMDDGAARVVLKAVPIRVIVARLAETLFAYGPALAVEDQRAIVPGGDRAEPIWNKLAGASPFHAGPFFRALIEKDEGRLIAYYSLLAELDLAHQRFFTENFIRTNRFYQLFMPATKAVSARELPYVQFARNLPLDDDGHVDFPGSAEVWMVAKGQTKSNSGTAHVLKKLRKAVAPDQEDDILIRLIQTRYKARDTEMAELDNFMAVSRIEAHREEPLSEASALLLAQHYAEARALYPYFTTLTALNEEHFLALFGVIEKARAMPALDANLLLGSMHGLVQLLCVLRRESALSGEQAASLFKSSMLRLLSATNDPEYAAAGLDSIAAIMKAAANGYEDPGIALRMALFPCASAAGSEGCARRAASFDRVLEVQRAPRISTLLALQHLAARFAADNSPAKFAEEIDRLRATLPAVLPDKSMKMDGNHKNLIGRYDPAGLSKVVQQMKQKSARRKVNQKELAKLAAEFMGELYPQVSLALTATPYAVNLHPDDLIAAEDPLLIRKHQYFDLFRAGARWIAPESDFYVSSEQFGSYFLGGFAQFSSAVGSALTVQMKADGQARGMLAEQLGSLRGMQWHRLRDSDFRLVELRVSSAAEWIVEAADRPDLLMRLAGQTMGLLSLSRRSRLLNGIAGREWHEVWSAATLADLLALGERVPRIFPDSNAWPSPALQSLRDLSRDNDGSRLKLLGPVPAKLAGCDHPHLLPFSPYEDYARYMLPKRLHERTAELKLYLALLADEAGLPPAALAGRGEAIAASVFGTLHLSDMKDWRSLLEAFGSLNASALQVSVE